MHSIIQLIQYALYYTTATAFFISCFWFCYNLFVITEKIHIFGNKYLCNFDIFNDFDNVFGQLGREE